MAAGKWLCFCFVQRRTDFFARARLFDFLGMNPGLKRQRQDQERLRQAAVVFDCTRMGAGQRQPRGDRSR